ncbi:uncharacterized protein DUF4437 [Dyadobacter jejuensis]|uniref:Uncharacterized protein DUF4437 n=1 Tax=Dyadobacter jejuensis TaxID=1082580 RepID=A0A316APF6_9BACT|nr:uncharacterized protein DUF4437 [Dyadobacter jejuensis]
MVKPINEAFDDGQRPINIHASNVVWLDYKNTSWVSSKSKAEISFLLNDHEYKSLFVKLPKGYIGTFETNGSILHSVVIQGQLSYDMPQGQETKVLDAGSYFGSTENATHKVKNISNGATMLYIRTNGAVYVK